jgi:cytochrome c
MQNHWWLVVLVAWSLSGCGNEPAAPPGQAAGASTPAPASLSRDALVAADYLQGRRAFQTRCSACHTLAADGAHLIGPNLHGLFQRGPGDAAEFSYSAALTSADFTWAPDEVMAWISDPNGYLPGNRMMIPEAVPEADRVPLISFMMLETGGADWPRPDITMEEAQPEGATLAERFPGFWNHLMVNTTRYRLASEAGELRFDAYFNTDGSVATDQENIRGFWHVNEEDLFCYALYGLPQTPASLVECFPVVAMSIPRFAEQLWTSTPAPGLELHGGIVAGRPEPLASDDTGADAHPGYWQNLFANTIRYEIAVAEGQVQVVDLHFNEDETVTSNGAAAGTWRVQGESGAEEMCYQIEGVPGRADPLSECFALVLMYNPRIGARWPSAFSEGVPYWAEVVAGRE